VSDRDWSLAKAARFRDSGRIGTPFYPATARRSATPWYFSWDLHHVVDVFDDFYAELDAMRTAVTMGEMSPLTKIEVSGPDAGTMVDHLVTREVADLTVGGVFFTPLCTPEGKVVTDGLLFRVDEQTYRFTGDPTYQWFVDNRGSFDVEVADVTDEYGILALQGPLSEEVLTVATGREWSDLDFSRMDRAEIAGIGVEVARQGFTGEHGYEIFTPAERGEPVWDAVEEAGEAFGIRPAGEYAIDVARVEAGLLIPGPDYANAGTDPTGSHTRAALQDAYVSSPFELGMGAFVDLNKDEFIGKQALADEQEAGGPNRRLVGLDIDWRTVVDLHLEGEVPPNVSPRVRWEPLPVSIEGAAIGRASSVTWGPSVRKLIGFGHLNRRFAEEGAKVSVEWPLEGGGTGPVPAEVVGLPFLPRRRT
jgi:aminomethyltransferase